MIPGTDSEPVATKHVVGVADALVVAETSGVITTYALGSCIGVTVFDPVAGIGGMLHFMLPNPPPTKASTEVKLDMFASTGLPLLFESACKLGAKKERLVVCAAGAAEVIAQGKMFQIGQRNRTMMRKIFWKAGIVLAAEDTGGRVARTMMLDLDSGVVRVRERMEVKVLWQP